MREQFEERSIDESSFKSAGDRRFCLCAEGGQEILSRSPFVEVVGTARDGLEALDLVERLEPDVVTCDLIMPELDGVGRTRANEASPVADHHYEHRQRDCGSCFNGARCGCDRFCAKPTALATEKIFEVSNELIEKVKAAGSISLNRIPRAPLPETVAAIEQATEIPGSGSVDMVVLGISTGGPQALKRLIPQLPADLPVPLLMVMHMPVGYTEMYAKKLNEQSALEVREAAEGDEVKPGMVLAPAGRHLSLKRDSDGKVVTHPTPDLQYAAPAGG